jgi:hypothetical protein
MNQHELAETLVSAAEKRADAHGMKFGEGADGDIRRFARTAAERLCSDTAGGPPTDVISTATGAFERLVEEMVSQASQIDGYAAAHPGVIGEQTLARALSKLCPLFPIC